ncbi:MAG TPA: FHA domain-containing protein [Terriglobales bacterium]|nr:FHA domain-containing protein [Terriglobales bacterium]
MAKLFLKFEDAVLKEVPLSQNVVTIGRLPDNTVQIDNLAVSGHHAKIYWDAGRYVIEDNSSLNGTYVNNARITRQALKDGDDVVVGKHTLSFKDEGFTQLSAQRVTSQEKTAPPVPKLESTVMLDTKQMKERLAGSSPASSSGAPQSLGLASAGPAKTATPGAEKIGVLTVEEGKTDQTEYLLTSKMSVIGKSEMASIKLKGWFAPRMAAIISKRDAGYFIAASEQKIKVKINGEEIVGQKPLSEGDTIEVAGITMGFRFQEQSK